MTSTIVGWLPVFTQSVYCNIVVDSLQFCQNNKGLQLFGFVILENHMHLIAASPDISNTLASLKRHTARQIIRHLQADRKFWLLELFELLKKPYKANSHFQIWQEGVYPKKIFSPSMFWQKLNYIHHNPVKRGLVDRPEYWRYSSARNYLLKDHSLITVIVPRVHQAPGAPGASGSQI